MSDSPARGTLVGMPVLDDAALRETSAWAKRGRKVEVPSLVGQTLGSYQITRVLGEGGVGIVYLGVHARLGTRVAIKVLHEDFLDSPEMVHRFVQEAKAANAVPSPHIVRFSDFGTLPDGRDYAVMEYLEGRPLDAELAERGQLPVGRVIGLMRQVAETMAAAHAVRIVHRDLKPENLFLEVRPDETDFVRILDFGIAKLADHEGEIDDGMTTAAGSVLGTPMYCAPEQGNGGPVGPRADIYALGAVAYELLTGRSVFQGNAVEVLVSKMTRDAPPLGRDDVPAYLEGLIFRMLEREAERRPASMDEVLACLPAVEPGSVVPAGVAVSIPAPPSHGSMRPRWVRGLPVLAGLAIGGVALFVMHSRSAASQASAAVVTQPAALTSPPPLPPAVSASPEPSAPVASGIQESPSPASPPSATPVARLEVKAPAKSSVRPAPHPPSHAAAAPKATIVDPFN